MSILVVLSFATKMLSCSSLLSSPMKVKSMCSSGPTSSRVSWSVLGLLAFPSDAVAAPTPVQQVSLFMLLHFGAAWQRTALLHPSFPRTNLALRLRCFLIAIRFFNQSYSHRAFITGQACLEKDSSSVFTMSMTYDPPFLLSGILSPVWTFLM